MFFKFHFFVSTYHQKLSNCLIDTSGFLGCANGKGSTCQCRRRGFDPWVGKIPWRRAWQPTPVFLPGESHGHRSLAGYSPPGRQESDTAEHTHTHTHRHMCDFEEPFFWSLLPGHQASLTGHMVKSLSAMQESQLQFLGGEDPLEKGMATNSRILAWGISMNREA